MANDSRERALKQVDALARLMDSQFRIPGTDFRFGLESIVGLLPVGGDALGFLASGGLVLTMARHGASPQLIARMLLNVLIDGVVGAVPVLGDLFDVTFKANNRNVELLRRHYREGKYTGSVWPVIAIAVVGLLVVGAIVAVLLYYVFDFLLGLFAGAGAAG